MCLLCVLPYHAYTKLAQARFLAPCAACVACAHTPITCRRHGTGTHTHIRWTHVVHTQPDQPHSAMNVNTEPHSAMNIRTERSSCTCVCVLACACLRVRAAVLVDVLACPPNRIQRQRMGSLSQCRPVSWLIRRGFEGPVHARCQWATP